MAPYRVMTVCTGNICRSPMAEVVLRHRLEEAGLAGRVEVSSTGISDEERGNPIDPRACAALTARGYAVPGRQARRATSSDVAGSGLVLAMTARHARALRRLAPTADDAAKVVLFRSFDPQAPVVGSPAEEHLLDMDDPWYGDDAHFEECLTLIEAAADGIVARIADEVGTQGRHSA